MRFLWIYFLLFFNHFAFAQKPAMDLAAYKNWPQVTHPLVSPDQQWLVYQLTDSTIVQFSLQHNLAVATVSIPDYKKHLHYNFDTSTGELLFHHLVEKQKPPGPPIEGGSVDLWSWNDSVLQSAQLYRLSAPDSFAKAMRWNVSNKSWKTGDSVAWSQYHPIDNYVGQTLKKKYLRRLAKRFVNWQVFQVVARLPRNEFIVKASSDNGSADIIRTRKFKGYKQLTDVHPEKNWNGYTVEELEWTTKDIIDTVLLYKPEDFDSTKLYPVIVSLGSERLTGQKGTGLYQPVLSNGIFNTAYFVSNGYVVVDLPATIVTGRPGPSMLERVMQAVNNLGNFPWVDTSCLGLQGHGVAAYFVNYIITQTNTFKAAQASAGVNDLISHYGSVDGKGESFQDFYDQTGGFFGKTLWQDSAAYIWQSPVIVASKIHTPILLMHNREDMVTPFAQGAELFIGMRRLGNRCWMLQYDNEGHVIRNPDMQEDFTVRLKQFFDHYLKDAGAPIWMTRGIPARNKGIENGLGIDPEIKTPPIGSLLNDAEYKKRFGDRPRDKSVFDLKVDD